MDLKKVIAALGAVALIWIFAGCDAGDNLDLGEDGNDEAEGSDITQPEGDDRTTVSFWHSMGGNNLNVLEELVEQYNDSQDEVFVEPMYQGSYREAFSQINSVVGTDQSPDLMQLNEESLKPMIDSGFIKPMQDFIDEDNFDIGQLEPRVLGRYEVDGQLYSMPFNPSVAVMFYNKEAFEEVGLDPDNPPHTYSEIEEAAADLTNSDRYGFNIRNFGWHYEQLRVNRGAYTVNNENGHAAPATEALLNSEEMVDIFTWIKRMYDDGVFANYGRDGDDVRDAFYDGSVAMFIDSSSTSVPTIESAPFEVGIAEYPVPDDVEPHGSVIGGASLWIFDDIPEENQQAAWDFVKFLAEPETQAFWTTNTGYFPITTDVFETEEYEEYLETYPQFQAALDQLNYADVTPVTQGAFIGVYPDIRVVTEDQLERVLDGSVEPQEALDNANETINDDLERYERTQGGD